jgi:hypothetical protein
MFKSWRKNRLQNKLEVAEAKLAFHYELIDYYEKGYPQIITNLVGEIALLKAKLRRFK